MLQIVPGLADAWKTNRDQVTSSVTRIMDALAERSKNVPGAALDESTMNTAYTSLAARYDTRFGGFGQPPKFPIPHQLRFLLRYHKRTGNVAALEMVEHTLQEMRKGGIWDHIGYGFHRYSTDLGTKTQYICESNTPKQQCGNSGTSSSARRRF